ncbi:MFS transporter [Alicyclobacillus tolerans]|uniref:Predicted arabinose efflux permease, MFS family n=1 Tax=Alicyclobacillus tolerans TaxID=90970 RepID=A0A1M6Y9T4_9BACL|nr:MFS transporter [Alicyclobacillus montanus]SHL14968.1 Predicted arabinose efflux permease, MFS family [Alicyclobacillus montanus]
MNPQKHALGIKPNLYQFLWLVFMTILVGMTVGLERTVVPLLGKNVYHITSITIIFAFVIAFGITKAVLNLVAGHLSDKLGRRPILIVGWLLGIPMILLLLFVHSWTAVIVANVFLGANQAFAWTMTVTQQLDLAGPKQRGLAMGINEATGYIGVAISTTLTGIIATHYGLLQAPFVYGALVLFFGLGTSLLIIRETRGHVIKEANVSSLKSMEVKTEKPAKVGVGRILWTTTIANPTLSACSQAGLVNKLADTLVWAMLPLFLAGLHVSIVNIGLIGGTYTVVWGFAQFGTGILSDIIGRKPPIVTGMALLGLGILAFGLVHSLMGWIITAAVMGLGMALLYPNLNSAVADVAPPEMRGGVLGVYRLWRDGGYAIGGLLLAFTIHLMGMLHSLYLIGVIVLVSMLIVLLRMKETHSRRSLNV